MHHKFLTSLGFLLASSLAAVASFPQHHRSHENIQARFPRHDKVRGVNLGGWLLLEAWLTPTLFDATNDSTIVDEWTFCEKQNKTVALAALEKHWSTWITEPDMVAISAAGLNHVRIPIGYWAFKEGYNETEPYITGQLPYLLKAIEWAGKYDLKVIIDLHGAPGSQNGFDNSGHAVDFPGWHTNPENIERTNKVVEAIAEIFKDDPVASVIAPLNEPAGFRSSELLNVTRQFWLDSYHTIRGYSDTKTVMIHDAFQSLSYWDEFMPTEKFNDVWMDTHIYQVFGDLAVHRSKLEHLASACSHQESLEAFHMPVVVGEWSVANTDCAKDVNGRGVGSRFDGTFPGSTYVDDCKGFTGRGPTFSLEYRTFLRQFWEAQVITYEKGAGWIFWTWKAEESDEWSYQAGLLNGWIPTNPHLRLFPDICSSVVD